jgi:hypothetical protein
VEELSPVSATLEGQPGRVVQLYFADVRQEIDQRPGQYCVFKANGPIGPGTNNVNGTHVGPQLFAHGTEVHECGCQNAVGQSMRPA